MKALSGVTMIRRLMILVAGLLFCAMMTLFLVVFVLFRGDL